MIAMIALDMDPAYNLVELQFLQPVRDIGTRETQARNLCVTRVARKKEQGLDLGDELAAK